MTTTELTERCREQRAEFWQGIGSVHAEPRGHGDADEAALWPAGTSSYLRVLTVHSGIVTTDGLSDPTPTDRPGAVPGLGLELYVEGSELMEDDPGTGRWVVSALEEGAGAVAGAVTSVGDALAEHGLLSLELSGADAPEDWVADGRLGVLIGVELPGRATGFDVDGVRVHALSFTPLRPEELSIVRAEGTPGRRRVAEALAAQGWYSYADSERPAVL